MLLEDKRYKQFVQEFERKIYHKKTKLLFLCIGSNHIIGDSFGPLVGSFLKEKVKNFSNVYIKGNMKKPVNISKIEKEIQPYIYQKYLIVVIDSAITNNGKVGEIFVTQAPMILGEGIGKTYITIGDYSIKGAVCYAKTNEKANLEQLRTVPPKVVFQLANTVSEGIYQTIKKG